MAKIVFVNASEGADINANLSVPCLYWRRSLLANKYDRSGHVFLPSGPSLNNWLLAALNLSTLENPFKKSPLVYCQLDSWTFPSGPFQVPYNFNKNQVSSES